LYRNLHGPETGREHSFAEAAAVMDRRSLLTLCMLVLLAGCRQPKADEVSAIVDGTPNVQVQALQILPASGEGRGLAGESVFYVSKVVFANNSSAAITPAIDHFVFTTMTPRATYRGLMSGIPSTVDVSNPTNAVAPGDKQEYTVVFRTPLGATGTVSYQP